MLPLGHVAVAYAVFSLTRRNGSTPTTGTTMAVVVGSQLPDVVDKPLAWGLHLLPTGRTLGHSLLTAGVVVLLLWYTLPVRRNLVVALAVGWCSHTIADMLTTMLAGATPSWGTLLWPLTPVPPYETELSAVARISAVDVLAVSVLELSLFSVAVLLWYRDGRPGIDTLRVVARKHVSR